MFVYARIIVFSFRQHVPGEAVRVSVLRKKVVTRDSITPVLCKKGGSIFMQKYVESFCPSHIFLWRKKENKDAGL